MMSFASRGVRKMMSILLAIAMIVAGNYLCMGWSSNYHHRHHHQFGSRTTTATTRKRTSPLRYREGNQEDFDSNNNISPTGEEFVLSPAESPIVNTSFLDPHREELMKWLTTLSGVERSEPLWVGNDLLHVSPSDVLQSRLDSLLLSCGPTTTALPKLFESRGTTTSSSSRARARATIRSKVRFDWDWKYALVKLFSQEKEHWTTKHWKKGISNTHPLRLQLVAIPPNTSLQPHVHPAIELDIPIVGTLYEERPPIIISTDETTTNHNQLVQLIPSDLLDRAPHHSLGTPLSNFSEQPTPQELQQIHQDLTDRVSAQYRFKDLYYSNSNSSSSCCCCCCWETRSITAGESLVNSVGSMHRSFTKDDGCLLFVLGPNVHAHFRE